MQKKTLKSLYRELRIIMNCSENSLEFSKNLTIEEYKNIVKKDKTNLLVLKKLAYYYKQQHNYMLAGQYFTQIKYLTPFDKEVYYELGLIEYEKGNCCKSKKNFIQAIKLFPEYYDAFYGLAKAHELCDENEMAEMIYLKIIECKPSYTLAYNQLANLYFQMGNYTKAIKYFRELLCVDSEFENAYLGLANVFEQKGQQFEAKKYYKKYLEINPFSTNRDYVLNKLQKLRQPKSLNRIPKTHLILLKNF